MKKQIKTFFITITFLFFGVFMFTNQVHAETEVSGNITSDTTWTLVDSPYTVKSDIGVVKGTTLTIEPGVKMTFNNGTALRVAGSLHAIGTPENQILFTTPGEWEGIIFLSSDEDADLNISSFIEYSTIERMRLGIRGGFQPLLISNNIIRDSSTGLDLNGSLTSLPTKISNNFISNNSRGITISHGGSIEISKNEIANNSIGIWAFYNSANLDISYNNFHNNGTYNIYAQMGDFPVDATNNWWGATNESDITTKIYDYSDNIESQVINYKPYASEKFSNTFSGSMVITCSSFIYSSWSSCSTNAQQTRSIISSSPSGCTGGSPVLTQSCTYVPPTCTSWVYSNWNSCVNGQQARTITSSLPTNCSGGNPVLTQSCTYTPPTCISWTYSNWSSCINGQQTRTITSSLPANCYGGNPVLSQSCNSTPLCAENNWTSVLSPTICPSNAQQTKSWTKIGQCQNGVSHLPETVSCNYQTPTCTSFTYSNWDVCNLSGVQSRNLLSSHPSNCAGGNMVLSQSCVYTAPVCTSWIYSDWSSCVDGQQTRTIISSQPVNCAGSSPVLNQTCNNTSSQNTNDNTTTNNSTKNQKSVAKIDKILSKRLNGKLLLQVEQGGAIWYVDTKEYKKYSVTWANALPLFRKLSLGITDVDLAKIPVVNSGQTGNTSIRNRLKGKLLLQVQQGGAIWYVDHSGYRHSVTWENLMDLFKKLALGITNENLNKIPEVNL